MLISCALIIPYQEIIGNYSRVDNGTYKKFIIPYQEIIGNYSKLYAPHSHCRVTIDVTP